MLVLYLLFLVYAFIHFARVAYKSYQQGLPLGKGQNRTAYWVILLGIALGSFVIVSPLLRIIVFLIWALAFLLVYTIIGIHNKANHSGERLVFYDKEVRKSNICVCIGIGFGLLGLLLVYLAG